jgi:pimeloyl-ACP methyl ester carboxylesterase
VRPVVLLHGLLGSGRNLATLARDVVTRRPDVGAVLLDLTGHGTSPPLPPDADSTTLARDVLDSTRALGLTPPLAIVGHSLGGRVALRARWLEPAAIETVIVLDIPPGPLPATGEVASVLDVLLRLPETMPSRAEARAALIAEGLAPALADWLLLNGEARDTVYGWRIDRRALAALHARIASEDLWPAIESPRRPGRIRCIRGGDSRFVTDEDVARLQAAGCPVITIPNAGHFLHAEQPRLVADAVAAGLG